MQDLEIYIRDLEPAAISGWLENQLDDVQLDDSDVTSVVKGSAWFNGTRLQITLYPGAFGKRFTSVLMEGMTCPGTVTWTAPAVPGGPWKGRYGAAPVTGKKAIRWKMRSGGAWTTGASNWWSGTEPTSRT